jgi:hypothetical protein
MLIRESHGCITHATPDPDQTRDAEKGYSGAGKHIRNRSVNTRVACQHLAGFNV